MILAISFLLLWQGTFAQPQLDGRYGVDRVAMEKQAGEAADSHVVHHQTVICHKLYVVHGEVVNAQEETCQPSPQITAVRAVSEVTMSGCDGGWIAAGDAVQCAGKRVPETHWKCESDSAIGPFENRKGEHWCLKIEEAKN